MTTKNSKPIDKDDLQTRINSIMNKLMIDSLWSESDIENAGLGLDDVINSVQKMRKFEDDTLMSLLRKDDRIVSSIFIRRPGREVIRLVELDGKLLFGIVMEPKTQDNSLGISMEAITGTALDILVEMINEKGYRKVDVSSISE